MRAPATSAMAVAWGTPMPSTPRVVQAIARPYAHEHPDRTGAHGGEAAG